MSSLHVFFVVIVLDSPVSGCELAAVSGLQNLELHIAFLAALLEPTLVYKWLVHLVADQRGAAPDYPLSGRRNERVNEVDICSFPPIKSWYSHSVDYLQLGKP